MFRRPALLALLAPPLLLTACGPADPCGAPATGVDLHAASLQQLAITATTLDCAGAVNGSDLRCAGAAEVATKACGDGFGVTLEASGITLLVHLANNGTWTAGASLLDGTPATGAMSIAGLGAELQPPTGTALAGAFDLLVDKAKVNGAFTTRW